MNQAQDQVFLRYVRKRGRPIGCLAVIVRQSSAAVFYGWSLCRRGDTFTKRTGRELALWRAYRWAVGQFPRQRDYPIVGGERVLDGDVPQSLYKALLVLADEVGRRLDRRRAAQLGEQRRQSDVTYAPAGGERPTVPPRGL